MKSYVTSLGIALTLALPHAAQAQGPTPLPVPTNTEVPAPNHAFLLGRGFGTQDYECQPVSSPGQVGCVLFTPQATLFGDRDELPTHFFSPNPIENGIIRATWQDSRDTSIVWGRVIESSVDPTTPLGPVFTSTPEQPIRSWRTVEETHRRRRDRRGRRRVFCGRISRCPHRR